MSGHSKWSQIKRQKAVTDQKRGSLFTKLANAITIAAKSGDAVPDKNFKLRIAIEKAKSANMPSDNIERAIKRGSGELSGETVEQAIYEGYGPQGTAIIIDTTTNNKNRTASAIRSILSKYQGNLGNTGSVMWNFSQKGVIRILKANIQDKEKFELKIIDAGAEDILEEEEGFTILSKINDLDTLKELIEKENISIESAEVEFVPNEKIKIEEESIKKTLNKLFEELEANEDVNNYFTNADL